MGARKSYPALRWLGAAAVLVFLAGVLRFFAGAAKGEPTPLLLTVVVAGVLPFLALAFPRRAAVAPPGPALDLSGKPPQDLKAALRALDEAHDAGELSDDRYRKAKDKVQAALRK